MIKKSIVFSLISILLVCYFIFNSAVNNSKIPNNDTDSIFVSQTIGVKEVPDPQPMISSEKLMPVIKKYRFLISPY